MTTPTRHVSANYRESIAQRCQQCRRPLIDGPGKRGRGRTIGEAATEQKQLCRGCAAAAVGVKE